MGVISTINSMIMARHNTTKRIEVAVTTEAVVPIVVDHAVAVSEAARDAVVQAGVGVEAARAVALTNIYSVPFFLGDFQTIKKCRSKLGPY